MSVTEAACVWGTEEGVLAAGTAFIS